MVVTTVCSSKQFNGPGDFSVKVAALSRRRSGFETRRGYHFTERRKIMKKFVTIAAVAALATLSACSIEDSATEDAANAVASAEAIDQIEGSEAASDEASDAAEAGAILAPVGQQHQL